MVGACQGAETDGRSIGTLVDKRREGRDPGRDHEHASEANVYRVSSQHREPSKLMQCTLQHPTQTDCVGLGR
jgi:hypothetical protein